MRCNQNGRGLGRPTGATLVETSEERVGPITLAVRLQRHVLGVGVGSDLHPRVSLHDLSACQGEETREERTVG